MLRREDIEKKAQPFQNEEYRAGEAVVLHHDLFTNGIGYVDLVFRAGSVPVELIPYLGLLKSVLGQMDTEHYSYGEFSNELNLHTGGISCRRGDLRPGEESERICAGLRGTRQGPL